jgi:hypothetical protein
MPITLGNDVVRSESPGTLSFRATDATDRFRFLNSAGRVLGSGLQSNITASLYNGGQLGAFRNKIINGDMNIAQRGTSIAVNTSGYTLDRWTFSNDSSVPSLVTVTQSTDVPTNTGWPNRQSHSFYSLRATVTTADTSISTTDYGMLGTPLEGYNVRDLIGRTFTISFWVRSAKTGTHCVSLRNAGNDRSYVLTYTVNNINTWEFKSVTVHGGLITAGTWDWTTGYMYLNFSIKAIGSTFQTTAGAWQTGNFIGTSGQVNVADTVGNIFAITGVQMEVGDVATVFEQRPPATELILCERYYQVYSGFGQGNKITFKSYAPSAPGTYYIPGLLRTEMRASAVTTVEGFALTNASAFSVTAARNAFRYNVTATVTGGIYMVDGTSTDARITFSAE